MEVAAIQTSTSSRTVNGGLTDCVGHKRVLLPCMHHRVLHILPTSLAFNVALQAAASRAWARCALTRVNSLHGPKTVKKRHEVLKNALSVSHSSRSARLHTRVASAGLVEHPLTSRQPPAPCRLIDIDPNDLREEDIRFIDTGRSDGSDILRGHFSYDRTFPVTVVGPDTLPIRGTSLLPSPRSKNSLYQNLLYLLMHGNPRHCLPALIDYHDLHPNLRSTRSYNLLIGLAIRHASVGILQWLFKSMEIDGISANLETRKLRVRWLVQSDQWDRAFELVYGFRIYNQIEQCTLDTEFPRLPSPQLNVPIPLWLELFLPIKRGFADCRWKRQSDCCADDDSSYTPADSPTNEPHDIVTHVFRYQVLMENRPSGFPEKLSDMDPRTVYHVLQLLLRTQDKTAALSLTKLYLVSLPQRLSRQRAQSCLDIIHLHLAIGTSSNGLSCFFEVHRTLVSLLKLHPSLRPTCTTVLLLLAPLRRAKRCGTIAWKLLERYKSQWGAEVEDRRVRRRVAMLAMKEGRTDIVDKVLVCEGHFEIARRAWKIEGQVLGGKERSSYKTLCRAPERKVFRRNGKEQCHWQRLKRRLQGHTAVIGSKR
ncbi:hypothetical protein AX17_000279 [Amanita inopinata Kibby_2008]|nr:hypothetical protein AX17_000279 [Amanita inopinata Kibby_2008]